jgi:hypothetical protein
MLAEALDLDVLQDVRVDYENLGGSKSIGGSKAA